MKSKPPVNLRHGHAYNEKKSAEYNAWCNMKARCTNPNNPQYKDYGGRGITFCPEWAVFKQFLNDMGPKPEGLTLERVDNEKGYSPTNCEWRPMLENCNNRRTSKLVEFNGVVKSLADWARVAGITRGTMTFLMKQGWPLERAFAPKN